MSETWLEAGIRMIEGIDKELPADTSLDDRKRAVQKEAWRFHGGTSWGQKVWPKAKRIYFAKKYGDRPKAQNGVPEGYLSPLERLIAKSRPSPL